MQYHDSSVGHIITRGMSHNPVCNQDEEPLRPPCLQHTPELHVVHGEFPKRARRRAASQADNNVFLNAHRVPGTALRGYLDHLLQATFASQGPQGASQLVLFTRTGGGIPAAHLACQGLCLEEGPLLVPEASSMICGDTGVPARRPPQWAAHSLCLSTPSATPWHLGL